MLTLKKSDCNVTIRKKRGFKPVLWITMVAVLFSVFAPSSGNLFVKAANSPAKYYQFIEKENLNKQIDALTKGYADYIKNYQQALKQQAGAEVTMDAVLSPDFAKSAGLEGLKSIKTSITSMSKGDLSKSSMTLFVNDKSLTSMETYFNLEGFYYFLIPDLSKAYLKLSMDQLTGTTTATSSAQLIQNFMKDPISEKSLNKLLKKYASMATSQISEVDMTKNSELNINEVSATATKLTVHIDEKTSLKIAKDILTTAKKDRELKKLFTSLGIYTEKQYDAQIKSSLKEVNSDLEAFNKKKSNGKDSVLMSVWVDSKGKITGRSFKGIDGEETGSFGYQTARKGITLAVKAWIKEGETTTLKASGSFTKNLSGVSGDMALTFEDEYSAPKTLKVSLKDFKYTVKDNNSFINGEINLSGKSLDGISFNAKCTGDINKQDITFKILQENQPLATITTTAKEVPFKDFNMPSSSDKVYDLMTESDKYMLEADFVNYLKGIKEKSDVKAIDDYIDTVISSFVNN